MKKYIELKITGSADSLAAFVERIKFYSSSSFVFSMLREDSLLRSGHFIEFLAKRPMDFRSRVILFWDETGIRMSNIIPKTVSYLTMKQYNAVLKHFYDDVVCNNVSESLRIEMTKEENSMQDLISSSAYQALLSWESNCNKSSPTSHPNDRYRWMDFICELYINKDYLSLSDFRNWLIEDR